MDAQEAETAYRLVKSQLDSGKVSLDEYNRRVSELRYQDNTGTWWAISPADGSWLKWTGSAWVPAFAQAVLVTPQAPVQPAPQPSIQRAAVQQPVQQEAAKPSWYIPPVSSQQKPATAQPATAQPVQQPVQAPPAQPANSSHYLPSAGSAQQPVIQQPAAVVEQPAPTGIRQPWSTGKKFGIASIVFGIVAFLISHLIFPYSIAIIGIILGALAVKYKYKFGIIGIILSVLAIIIDYFYIFIFK